MEERIILLEKQLADLKNDYYRDNFESRRIFIKDVDFNGKVGFFGKSQVSQAAAITAPTSPSAAYSQAEAQSAVTAINSIRTVLQNLGFTL